MLWFYSKSGTKHENSADIYDENTYTEKLLLTKY